MEVGTLFHMFSYFRKGNCYKTLVMVKDLTLGLDMVNQHGTFAELKIRSERQKTFEESLNAYTVSHVFLICLLMFVLYI